MRHEAGRAMPRGPAVAGGAGASTRLRLVGWALWSLYLVLTGVALAIQSVVGWQFAAAFVIGEAFVVLVFATTGLVVLLRQPANRIAWIFLLMPLGVTIERAAGAYALAYVAGQPDTLPEMLAVWCAGSWIPSGLSILLMFGYMPLLFPDGRPPSPRWRVLLYVLPVMWLLQAAAVGTRPGPFDEPFDRFLNPLGWESGRAVFAAATTVGEVMLPLILLCGVASLVVRWRRSTGVEREQLKWFLFAVFVLFLVMVLNTILPLLAGGEENDTVGGLLFLAAISVLPFALGVAVLRHRLYEIDGIVSRTVSYVLVAAILTGVYVGGILGLSSVARALTGESGDLVVALSTLLVAALFQPVRRRVQSVVDRRFNRRRYDAQALLEDFGRSLRDELDSGTLASWLRTAAASGLQPATVSVQLLGTTDTVTAEAARARRPRP